MLKTTKTSMLAGAILASQASAQLKQASTPEEIYTQWFGMFDQDQDGVITQDEYANVHKALDRNRDGAVGPMELGKAVSQGLSLICPTLIPNIGEGMYGGPSAIVAEFKKSENRVPSSINFIAEIQEAKAAVEEKKAARQAARQERNGQDEEDSDGGRRLQSRRQGRRGQNKNRGNSRGRGGRGQGRQGKAARKQVDPVVLHEKFPFFASFDDNVDGRISADEFVDAMAPVKTYDDLVEWMSSNASEFCQDPRPNLVKKKFGELDLSTVISPMADIYYMLDTNADHVIDTDDITTAFAVMDTDNDEQIQPLEMAVAVAPKLAELCYYSAIMETERDCSKNKKDSDSDDEADEDDIVRRRRCNNVPKKGKGKGRGRGGQKNRGNRGGRQGRQQGRGGSRKGGRRNGRNLEVQNEEWEEIYDKIDFFQQDFAPAGVGQSRRGGRNQGRNQGGKNRGRGGNKGKGKKGKSFFGAMDKDRSKSVSLEEFYIPFSKMDKDGSQTLSADELTAWMVKNEKAVCKPYERLVNRIIVKQNGGDPDAPKSDRD